ncbi:hypothetical protein ACHOLT_11660 [Desulfitobacterium sp. Sab5]|uniref:hypothetical protein n=1 Tax=Desulfitobacterium nosdiversum TaxID=3375356 RepID=UPI003CF2073E
MDNLSDKISDERYPNHYFEHYIAMFQSEINRDGFKEHANFYIQIEGLDEFSKLIGEIILIDKNNDWGYFADLAKEFDQESMNIRNIKELAETAVEVHRYIIE